MKRKIRNIACALSAIAAGASATASPPRHVVIVFEENHAYSQIIGSPSAPYINQLAAQGANLTNMFGISHPSQPSYIGFWSGAFQGVFDDGATPGTPYTTPNLGAELLAAGQTFAIFSEDLPAEGSLVTASGGYRRKHNPVANWQAAAPGLNQYSSVHNKPFSAFPSDYSLLPAVSIVVPTQANDMHDGTIAQGDAWLSSHIGPYATWAMNNDSMLILTFDEDNGGRNQITTILYGPMIRPGPISTTTSLFGLLRTIEEMYSTGHAGAAAYMRPIVGAFKSDPVCQVVSFQRGIGGYTGQVDTRIDATTPDSAYAGDTTLFARGSPASQVLVRFDGIIGTGAGHVPSGAAIVSAKLVMFTGINAADGCNSQISVYRSLQPWDSSSTWNSLQNGISFDGIEAAPNPDCTLMPYTLGMWTAFDVSDTVQAWVSGSAPNLGWVIAGISADDWRFPSSKWATVADRPRLEITYTLDVTCPAIQSDPQSTIACRGGDVSFSVTASGTSLTYEWRHDGAPISYPSSPDLIISNVAAADEGTYDCVVSNFCGSITSAPATLQVCIGDFNCDGGIDGADVQAFFEAWEAGDPSADVNADGGVDGSDVGAFFLPWEAGGC